ncbi:MAG TPA: hypothetical protein VEF91_07960, partial [Verrucomicrobiae bacterium]|nr:hypothetical protein [Verrucomicrobiae bacterium]
DLPFFSYPSKYCHSVKSRFSKIALSSSNVNVNLGTWFCFESFSYCREITTCPFGPTFISSLIKYKVTQK